MKIGDLIQIIHMEGEPNYYLKTGRIEHIDDIGQLHGTWGSCAIVPEIDEFEVAKVCCICGREFFGYGHNTDPLKTEGRCCDRCNFQVMKARFKK